MQCNSTEEKLIVDYITIERSKKSDIKDVRVKRSYGIGSDHFLLEANIKYKDKK